MRARKRGNVRTPEDQEQLQYLAAMREHAELRDAELPPFTNPDCKLAAAVMRARGSTRPVIETDLVDAGISNAVAVAAWDKAPSLRAAYRIAAKMADRHQRATLAVRLRQFDLTDQRMPLDRMLHRMARIIERELGNGNDIPPTVDQVALEVLDRQQQLAADGHKLGLETGVRWVDRLKLRRGRLAMVIARQKTGKSFWLQQCLVQAARAGHRCLMFSTELDGEDLTPRLLTQEHVYWAKDREPNGPEEFEQAKLVASALPSNLHFAYESKAANVLATAANVQRTHGLDILAIDYVQDLSMPKDWGDRLEAVGEFIRELKRFAKRHRVMVFVISSTRKAHSEQDENEQPKVSDAFGSTGLVFTADYLITLWRPYGHPSIVGMAVPQARSIQTPPTVYLQRDPHTLRYEELDEATARAKLADLEPRKVKRFAQ